jgi:hypothetical protein
MSYDDYGVESLYDPYDDYYEDDSVFNDIDAACKSEEETLWTFGFSDVEIFYTWEEGCSLTAVVSPRSWIQATKQVDKYLTFKYFQQGFGAGIQIYQDDLDGYGFDMEVDYDACAANIPTQTLNFVWEDAVSVLANDILEFASKRCESLCAELRSYDGSA